MTAGRGSATRRRLPQRPVQQRERRQRPQPRPVQPDAGHAPRRTRSAPVQRRKAGIGLPRRRRQRPVGDGGVHQATAAPRRRRRRPPGHGSAPQATAASTRRRQRPAERRRRPPGHGSAPQATAASTRPRQRPAGRRQRPAGSRSAPQATAATATATPATAAQRDATVRQPRKPGPKDLFGTLDTNTITYLILLNITYRRPTNTRQPLTPPIPKNLLEAPEIILYDVKNYLGIL
jgi:hypothetical protein